MGRARGPGCVFGCLSRITSLLVICAVLAATAYFGSRLLWVPDWRAGTPDAVSVQAFSQGLASIALGGGNGGRLELTEAEANAFLAVKYPSDPVRLSLRDGEVEFASVTRPWPDARTFLPDRIDDGIRSFRILVVLRGKPVVERGILKLEPSSVAIGKQSLPLYTLRLSRTLSGTGLPEFEVPDVVKSVESGEGKITITIR